MTNDGNEKHMMSLAQKHVLPVMLAKAQSLTLFLDCKLFAFV